ncbi:MAG: hypothetical protein ABR511_04075 [Acidimicrobiales bacterium]
MEQLQGVVAVLVAVGGMLTILVVLGGPVVHRDGVVLRLRHGLSRLDHALAAWQRADGRRSPHRCI